jgi:hypothetical protein
MTCRIEQLASDESRVVLRLCGRLQVEHVITLKQLIGQEDCGIVIDLMEVTLVDREAVTFLAVCELKGIELRNCPAFLREWVSKEQLGMGTPNTASGAVSNGASTEGELGTAKGGVVGQTFRDTSTWDEIIRILEEEAIKKLAS